MRPDQPDEPWLSFLNELDGMLSELTELHCIGGFAVVHAYGSDRTTTDLDILLPAVVANGARLIEAAGKASALKTRYGVHLEVVGVAAPPDEYESRLIALYPGCWRYLRLFTLEAHDLALTKLERNIVRDRVDVNYLAKAGYLDPEILRTRYYEELRPYVIGRESWHDQTLNMWLEAFFPPKGESA